LIVSDNLHERLDEIIHCSSVKISTSVARLLKPFVVDRFSEIS
jgi:hypothetical protein